MEALEILDLVQKGESSKVQFKEKVNDAHAISQELVAFSNTKGGVILIGVNDKTGGIIGLSFEEIQNTNKLIVNAATNNVNPSIIVNTDTVVVSDKSLIIINVEEGLSKPYKDRNGAIWVKNGSDKRRVTSNEETARLLQESKIMFADESIIRETTIADIDNALFKDFIQRKYKSSLEDLGISTQQIFENLNLSKEGNLTLAGLLFFSTKRDVIRPMFSIQCVAVDSTDLTGNTFADNEPAFGGTLLDVFKNTISFIDRNLKKIPTGTSFNSPLAWEIPYEVFEELIVNALIHRDYFINSTIKVVIYSDRIEIISPGKLPNSLTVENIKGGISISRNPVLQSLAQYILPYRGLGTGISRAISAYGDIEFINDVSSDRFIVRIKRP